MIDYGLAGSTIPLLLGGTMIGVMLTKILPPIIVVILLSAYLVFSGYKMYIKAKSTTKKENLAREKEKKALEEKDDMKKPLLNDQISDVNKRSQFDNDDDDMKNHADGQAFEVNKNKNESNLNNTPTPGNDKVNVFTPEDKPASFCTLFKKVIMDVFLCIFSYLVILIIAFLRGGHGLASVIGIGYCSATGWIFFVIAQLACISCSLISVYRNREALLDPRKAQLSQESRMVVTEEDLNNKAEAVMNVKGDQAKYELEKRNLRQKLILLLFCSYSAGVGAGTLGIGGGMIMDPV